MIDYLDKNLDNKAHFDNFQRLWDVSLELSFDVIQGIVEELNFYPDLSFKECISMMGVSLGGGNKWDISSVVINGKLQKVSWVSSWHNFTPAIFLGGSCTLDVYLSSPSDADSKEALANSSYVVFDDEGDARIPLNATKMKADLITGGKIVVFSDDPEDSFRIVLEPTITNGATLASVF